MKKNKKVLLGLSGGVDSAVSLYLLKKEGYQVDCLFMRNWDSTLNSDILGNPNDKSDICPQEKDYNDARQICEKLNVKLLRKDFVKEYWDDVFSYFINEYKKNRTPNPDVLCNNEIKFKAFLNYAINNNYDFIATGHYANTKDGNLFLAKDKFKDQTYFLAQLQKDQLKKVIFPLAKLNKKQVRKIAEKLDLAVKDKKDSTGICFIGERNFRDFLKNYIKIEKGEMQTLNGEYLKDHIGLPFYTIGQRKGLDLGTINGKRGPWFVVGKKHNENILLVENKDNIDYLYSNKAFLYNVILRENLNKDRKCMIRFRHQQKMVPGIIYKKNEDYIIEYKKTRSVTPGQLAAIYFNNKCLGAGFVDKCYFNDKLRRY